jgi:hypothetical protein
MTMVRQETKFMKEISTVQAKSLVVLGIRGGEAVTDTALIRRCQFNRLG